MVDPTPDQPDLSTVTTVPAEAARRRLAAELEDADRELLAATERAVRALRRPPADRQPVEHRSAIYDSARRSARLTEEAITRYAEGVQLKADHHHRAAEPTSDRPSDVAAGGSAVWTPNRSLVTALIILFGLLTLAIVALNVL